MAGRSKYTDEDRARVLNQLTINDGNVKRTARDLDMPVATVRDWKQRWEAGGVPAEVADAQPKAVDTFIKDATRVRNKALEQLDKSLDNFDKPKDLATVIGILDDKINRASTIKVQGRSDTLAIGIQGTPEQVQALFTNWADKTVTATHQREQDILEVNAEEVPEQPETDSVPLLKP